MAKTPKSNRRDFLRGKSALDAFENLMDSPELPPPEKQQRENQSIHTPADSRSSASQSSKSLPSYLLELSRPAMGCQFQISLNAGQYDDATEQAVEALNLIENIEKQLTVYNDESEVSRLNATAFDVPVPVAANLFQLLQQCVELNQATDQAFDMTSGSLSKIWGFFYRNGRLPAKEEIEEVLKNIGSGNVILNEQDQTVRFLQPGTEINLGSIGKGYALDCCAEMLLIDEIEHFLIHGGTSSVVARGIRKRTETSTGWEIGIPHPLIAGRRLGKVVLENQALGTSGAANQSFISGGVRYGHILDPRTGYPAQGVLSSTVIAPTAAEADALATSFFIMGPEKTNDYCQLNPKLGALIVTEGKRKGALQLDTFGIMQTKFLPEE